MHVGLKPAPATTCSGTAMLVRRAGWLLKYWLMIHRGMHTMLYTSHPASVVLCTLPVPAVSGQLSLLQCKGNLYPEVSDG